MGGNAIKQFGNVIRLHSNEFDDLSLDVVSVISHPELPFQPQVVPSYFNKETHGDMDVIVPASLWKYRSHDSIKKLIGAIDYVKNNSVTSYAVPYSDNLFQVDIISTNDDLFDFALNYFSYNDLGNLMGRISHQLGFKLGHKGLIYVIRDPQNKDHIVKEICLTKNWDEAITFFDYSVEKYNEGFHDLEDIFQYVMTSKFAVPSIFLLENRNSISRIRDRKRKTYNEFLMWLQRTYNEEYINQSISHDEKVELRDSELQRAKVVFPGFSEEMDFCLYDYSLKKHVSTMVNGERVRELTGLDGKALGIFMKSFKDLYDYTSLWNKDQNYVDSLIMEFYRG